MSKKRKIQRFNLDEGRIWEAIEGLSPFRTTYTLEEVCEKLNEQQFTIQSLKEENEKLVQNKCLPCELVSLQTKEIDKLKKENEHQKEEIVNSHKAYVECLNQIKDLKKENEQLKQTLENIGLNEKNDVIKMIEGRFFIRM